jgi:RimJ/RimL family protein N-acetyltransferase
VGALRTHTVRPFFTSTLAALRPISEADIEILRTWRNADRVRRQMLSPDVITSEQQRLWWKARCADPGYCQYMLDYDDRPLGTISFRPVAGEEHVASCGYYVDPTGAPPRTGTLLMYLALSRFFAEHPSHRVRCDVFATNELSLRLVARYGFVEEGAESTADARVLRRFVIDAPTFAARADQVRGLLFTT